jgi:hypothetical protein
LADEFAHHKNYAHLLLPENLELYDHVIAAAAIHACHLCAPALDDLAKKLLFRKQRTKRIIRVNNFSLLMALVLNLTEAFKKKTFAPRPTQETLNTRTEVKRDYQVRPKCVCVLTTVLGFRGLFFSKPSSEPSNAGNLPSHFNNTILGSRKRDIFVE